MDGYAVRHEDVATASADAPVHLPVVGEIGAGQAQLFAMSPGTAVKIMTGAPVPAGADSVVPYEWTDRGVAQVRIERAPTPRQHVRPAGDDVRAGDMLVAEGTVLGPRHLGLLAAVGRATVRSRPRPRVVVISTGSELREPGTELGHDSIYDGNSFLLAAAARRAGAIAYRVGIVPDEPRAFLDARGRPAGARRPRGHQRRGVAGRLRRGQGGTRAAGLGVVRRRRDAAGQAAGLRPCRGGRHADLHAAGQPRLVVHLVRAVRAAGDPQADGAYAVRPPDGLARGSPTTSGPRTAGASSRAPSTPSTAPARR